MAYTPQKPPLPETTEQLKARIPYWGVDLDPADRPSVPKLQWQEGFSGAHWEVPDQQPERHGPREHSIEHAAVTPVFGTAQPLHGVSGAIRRLAYSRFSEARLAHWLLLVAGDRVEATGAHLRSLATLRPDNPITETGVLTEASAHPVASRRGRVDVRHQTVDPVLVAGPWVAGAAVAWLGTRRLVRAVRG
ncbi:hypothetical protein [Blastococcus sp. SYSU D00813]